MMITPRYVEVWDFLHNHQVPILNIKVADSALNCLKVIDKTLSFHQNMLTPNVGSQLSTYLKHTQNVLADAILCGFNSPKWYHVQ